MPPGIYRLLLATLVVLHHGETLLLGTVAVGIFFLLSGYWIARVWSDKYAKRDSGYLLFISSRWWRLAPLFFAVQGLAILFLPLGWYADEDQVTAQAGWWLTQPLIAGSSQFGLFLLPSWSIDVEMQFYLVAPLLVTAIAWASLRSTIVAISMTIVWSLARLATVEGFLTPHLDIYLSFFLIGSVCAAKRWQPKPRAVQFSLYAVLLILAVILSIPSLRAIYWLPGSDIVSSARNLQGPLNVALILLAFPFTMSTVGKASTEWDRWCGDLSYPLYLFHWLAAQWFIDHDQLGAAFSEQLGSQTAYVVVSFVGAIALLMAIDRPLQGLRTRYLRVGALETGNEASSDPSTSGPASESMRWQSD